MNDLERTKEFLSHERHMVVSVADDDGPWAVPVTIRKYEGRVFEWDSKLDTRHSMAIYEGATVSLLLYRPRTNEAGQFGFYASATVTAITPGSNGSARYQVRIDGSWINDGSFIKRQVVL